MKLFFRPALALVLGTALAAPLSSCDYNWTPGVNPQFRHDFTHSPGWHNADVNRDSINNQQKALAPGGVGSAADIKNGTVQDQINSAPAGDNATGGQSASGQMGNVEQAQPKK